MLKPFCDYCEREIKPGDAPKLDGTVVVRDRPLTLQLSVAVDDNRDGLLTWNAGHICVVCLGEAVRVWLQETLPPAPPRKVGW